MNKGTEAGLNMVFKDDLIFDWHFGYSSEVQMLCLFLKKMLCLQWALMVLDGIRFIDILATVLSFNYFNAMSFLKSISLSASIRFPVRQGSIL